MRSIVQQDKGEAISSITYDSTFLEIVACMLQNSDQSLDHVLRYIKQHNTLHILEQ